MLFSSSIFLFVFLPICLFLYYLIPSKYRKIRNLFLLVMSLGFYAWGEPVFVILMLMSIIGNYIFGLLIDKHLGNASKSKFVLSIMLIFNLSGLFLFKYSAFFIENIDNLFNLNIVVPTIQLPIGISFFTFQAISYVIDVYRRIDSDGDIIKAQKNPVNVGLYIALFPQLIAGPIVRYKTVAQQIEQRYENFDNFCFGIKRFIVGLGKKVIISNNMALIADAIFNSSTNEISVASVWLGAIAYSLQIFFDFSGYSDMAIGLGKMFGFEFLENFNYPYISKSVSEFWRRWHISLGTWFKDYVYFPLGGSLKGKYRTILNLAIVWFLTGFWHGANWTYISWGIYFFIFISLEKVLKGKVKLSKYFDWMSHIYTLLVVLFGWVLFRANSIQEAGNYIKTMLGLGRNIAIDEVFILLVNENIIFLIAAILCSMPILSFMRKRKIYCFVSEESKILSFIYESIYVSIYIILFMITMSYIVKGAYNSFIYFNF